MARDVEVIQEAMIADLVARGAEVGEIVLPAQWSDYDYRQLLTFVASTANAVTEQNFDAFTTDLEAIIATVPPQTALWIQNLVLNIFQYSATDPQVIQFDTTNIVPFYTTINAALRIITQCAVVPGGAGNTTVLVAKAGPVALSTPELDALQATLNVLLIPGVNVFAVSKDSDKIFIGGTVKYNGSYSALIGTTVPAAIQAFLAAVPVTGIVSINSQVGLMRLTDLIAAVKAVPGVIDFELNNVNARPDVVAFVPGTNNLVSGNSWLNDGWNSGLYGAGYMTTETTAGSLITDSLTYIAL